MSTEFLSNFMRAAYAITNAERGLAVDVENNIHDKIQVEDTLLQSQEFKELLQTAVTQSIADNTATISNNLISADQAPDTNVHLHNLRLAVTIPLGSIGAVYLDQHIRNGVFEREVIDKLTRLGRQVIKNEQTDLSEQELIQLFEEM